MTKHRITIARVSSGGDNARDVVSLPAAPFEIEMGNRDETAPKSQPIRREVRRPHIGAHVAYDVIVEAWKEATQ